MNHISFQPQPPSIVPTNQRQRQQPQPMAFPPPKKLRRVSRACDFCHNRSIKCAPSEEAVGRCQNCVDFGVSCTYLRPVRKRGIKTQSGNLPSGNPHSQNGTSSGDGESDAQMLLGLTHGVQESKPTDLVDQLAIPERWKSMAMSQGSKIQNLVDVYFEVVYPIFPLFHSPSLQARVASRDYLTDPSVFADIMAICALASARARDGALLPGQWEPGHFRNPPSEDFFAAVKETMPKNLGAMRGLDWMRTCALLALYGIQVGKIDIMHQYLGMYHSLVSMDSLHDEKNWPSGIGIIETELRRRLFWSMYTLEVYASIVWGSIIRCREAQSHVSYPTEIDDEFISDEGYRPLNMLVDPQTPTNPVCWLHGLNFSTELYRVLEHAMDDFHHRQPPTERFAPADLFARELPNPGMILNKVIGMYEELPSQFKEAKINPSTGKGVLQDKFSFQAANIIATLQLVRMVLFTSEDATVEQKCAIARDLLESFNKIPVEFLRAISSPLLHHLAGIGAILGSAIQGPISESSYIQVRDVLLKMADLLSSLEIGFARIDVGAASRLHAQIANIDAYMNAQRQSDQNNLIVQNYIQTTSSTVGSNPNIDPTLQEPELPKFEEPCNPYNTNVDAIGMEAQLNSGGSEMGEQNLQLPPELLEGWPWPLNFSQGFASMGTGQF